MEKKKGIKDYIDEDSLLDNFVIVDCCATCVSGGFRRDYKDDFCKWTVSLMGHCFYEESGSLDKWNEGRETHLLFRCEKYEKRVGTLNKEPPRGLHNLRLPWEMEKR
jgi:hypothetical protein